jgi:hypothetical protein
MALAQGSVHNDELMGQWNGWVFELLERGEMARETIPEPLCWRAAL